MTEILERIKTQKEDLEMLMAVWKELLPSFTPAPEQFKLWVIRNGVEIMLYAIQETADKAFKLGGKMTPDHMGKFCTSVANAKRIAWRERGNEGAK
jgi:hypothetical protein